LLCESATSRYSRRKISTDDELSGLAAPPEVGAGGRKLAIAKIVRALDGSFRNRVDIVDMSSLSVLRSFDTARAIVGLCYADDGSYVETTYPPQSRMGGWSKIKWPTFPNVESMVDRMKEVISRCLTAEERQQLGLGADRPNWCIESGR
jgi:hypothetical protein